jgi:hypothetical protein
MPQLGPWRKSGQGDPTGGFPPPTRGLLGPVTTMPGGRQPANPTTGSNPLREALLQADTAVRSAANVLTFGWADKAEAAADALEQGGTSGWGRRYSAELAQQHARDAYDAGHRRVAQLAGDTAGVVLSVVGGPLEGVARLPGAVGLTARDMRAILGAGAATGVAGQRVADAVAGRPSSWQNEVGAGIGGLAQAGTLFLAPQRSAAIGGAVTSATQDILNGRPISFDAAAQGAAGGGLLGRIGSNIGTYGSDNLPPVAKGWLGEAMGSTRSIVNGLRRDWVKKTKDPIPGTTKGWFPDGRRGDLRFEDKFGPGATLSDNQKLAQSALGDKFWLNHFQPEDFGRAVSIPAAASAPTLTDQSPDQ